MIALGGAVNMKKSHAAVIVSIMGALVIFGALKLNKEPACVRIQAKVELAEEFCDGLAERAARERCQSLSEDVDVMGQCMRIVVPAAHSSCMGYLNMERLRQQSKDLCS